MRSIDAKGRAYLMLLEQIVRYGLSGAAALLVHLMVLHTLVEDFNVNKTLATVIGFCAAVPVNFWLQRTLVFFANGPIARAFIKYCMLTSATFVLNTLIFWILLEKAELNYMVAQVMTTIIIIVINFAASRSLIFPERPQDTT